MKEIYLNISDISSYIGLNDYEYVEPFERLFKRSDRKIFTQLLEELDNLIEEKQTKLNLKEDTKLSSKELKEILVLQGQIKELEEKKQTGIRKEIKAKKMLSEDQINIIEDTNVSLESKKKQITNLLNNKEEHEKEVLRSYVNTIYGTQKEDSAIDIFKQKYNIEDHELNVEQEFFKMELEVPNSEYKWYIGGKMDGIHKDYIIEVKNRTKRIFKKLRDYENTQIQLYLLLTGKDLAKLIQCKDSKIVITDILKDDDFIELTIRCVLLFCTLFEEFLSDIDRKREYINLKTSDKKPYLKRYFIKKVIDYRDSQINRELDHSICYLDDCDDI